MQKLARYFWSLSVGIVGFFDGLIFLGNYHTFENWQVGMAGFVAALTFAIPTYISISRVAASASQRDVQLLAFSGGLVLFGSLILYAAIAFH